MARIHPHLEHQGRGELGDAEAINSEAGGRSFKWNTPMPLYVLEPPARYVHHFNGPVIERVLPLAEARRVCASRGAPADACAWVANGACHLIVPRNGPVHDRAAYAAMR
jgi:hypothetical protein